MNSHLLQDGVVLLKLEALGSILPVLRCDIAGCAGQTALLHLGAFQNHLDSVAFNFLCHSLNSLSRLHECSSNHNNPEPLRS